MSVTLVVGSHITAFDKRIISKIVAANRSNPKLNQAKTAKKRS